MVYEQASTQCNITETI